MENVFDFFNKVFNLKKETEKIKKDEDENKHIMQWRRILETIISIIKNDYTPLWSLLYFYNEIISLNSKNFLFNKIRSNKNLMKECRNILKERLVQVIISNGNLMDLDGLTDDDNIDTFFFTLFDQKEFLAILEELTISKMNGEKKEFYLKDSCLKYLDMNYYFSPQTQSQAELYIKRIHLKLIIVIIIIHQNFLLIFVTKYMKIFCLMSKILTFLLKY